MKQPQQRISRRVASIRPSATVALADKARALKAEGRDIISLAAGEPDMATPSPICEAARRSLQEGNTHYTASPGLPALRQAISQKLKAENGVEVDPRGGVLVIPGAKLGVAYACLAFLDPGDECLVPEPAWVSYRECISLAEATYVPVPSSGDESFQITADALTSRVTPKTRMIILNSPTNPTGRVWSRDEQMAVAKVAEEYDLLVLSDELYEKILYDGHEHVSFASLPGMASRTLTLNGLSKAYAMTGWRLGYLAADRDLIGPMASLQQHTVTCAASFVQTGAIEALATGDPHVQEMAAIFERRRNLLIKELRTVPGVELRPPEGTFYAFLDIRQTGRSSSEVADFLLDEALVCLTPGSAFGESGEGFLRLSFAAEDEALRKACGRLRESMPRLLPAAGSA